ncbi:MAG TPA: CHASE3 domain-containing protein [Candidatus Acidoferrum sp.]|nr:CHASE3 domain-containing protein [Candidatus Acidoferrum sp.]
MAVQASTATIGWPVGRIAGLGVALLLILGAGLLSYESQRGLVSADRAADHSREVLYQTERLLSLLKDTGAGIRTYLGTHDDSALERNDAAVAALPRAMADLRRLTADDPAHQRRLAALQPIIDERLAWVDHLLQAGRQQGEAVFTPAETQHGRDLLDRISAIAAEITVEETQRGRVRAEAARRQAEIFVVPLLAGMLISVALIVLLFARMQREIGRRSRAEALLEERVQERTGQLAASEDRYRSLIELMQEAIWIHQDGKVVFANPAAARLFGAARAEELLGRSASEWVHPEDRERAAARSAKLRAGPTSVPVTEMRLLRDDGKVRTVAIHAVSFRQDGGMRVMASARDVTAQREAEVQLHQAQKMESVGQLTGGVAHDFNNLLTVVIGSLDAAVDRTPAEPRALVESALRAAERGATLVRQMLAFSRRQTLIPEALDLNELAGGMEDLLQRTLGEHIEIEMKPVRGLWPALADKAQVESALLNLAINARDAMPEGGKLIIETGNHQLDADYAAHNAEVTPGDYAMLAVTDTGTGMPPEVIERAFEPFFTTKGVGKGSGLGLSMIYGFAKQSGGHLKIYSEVGHGTTVRLYLPRQRAPAVAESAAAPATVDRHAGGGETILVVEDDPLVRNFVVQQLRALGYTVLEAADGPQARAQLESDTPIDLLLTDVVMPGSLTGRELAASARRRRPNLKTLYTSGYTENSIVHQGKLDPGVHFLSKPFRRQELARKVRDVLDDEPPRSR